MSLDFDKVYFGNISHIKTVLNKMCDVLVLILHQNHQSIVGQDHEPCSSIKPKFLLFLIDDSVHFHLLNQRHSSFFQLNRLRHLLLHLGSNIDILFYLFNNSSNWRSLNLSEVLLLLSVSIDTNIAYDEDEIISIIWIDQALWHIHNLFSIVIESVYPCCQIQA